MGRQHVSDETTSWKKKHAVWNYCNSGDRVRTQWRGAVVFSDGVNDFQLVMSVGGAEANTFCSCGQWLQLMFHQKWTTTVSMLETRNGKWKIDTASEPKVIEEILNKAHEKKKKHFASAHAFFQTGFFLCEQCTALLIIRPNTGVIYYTHKSKYCSHMSASWGLVTRWS